MKLYAIRDRLVDYFMTPFAAHEDQGVLNSIANLVSNEESNDPVKQAPHHFEIWRLADIDNQGHIYTSREFLADCSTLVRAAPGPGRATAFRGARQMATAPEGGVRPPGRTPEGTNAQERSPAVQTQAADSDGAQNNQGDSGAPRGWPETNNGL